VKNDIREFNAFSDSKPVQKLHARYQRKMFGEHFVFDF